MSLAYAMACAALWTLVPEFVKGESLGLAFGCVNALVDVMIMVLEVVIGKMLDEG